MYFLIVYVSQVGRKGACTLMSVAVLHNPQLLQFVKSKEKWTLDRKKSVPSKLVWTQKQNTRRRENGKIKVTHSLTLTHSHSSRLLAAQKQ